MIDRKSVVVYFDNDSFIKDLGQNINVIYKSKKTGCAILYFDSNKESDILKKLSNIKEINKIDNGLHAYKFYSFK